MAGAAVTAGIPTPFQKLKSSFHQRRFAGKRVFQTPSLLYNEADPRL
jgi:hypothetical protein